MCVLKLQAVNVLECERQCCELTRPSRGPGEGPGETRLWDSGQQRMRGASG